MNDDVIVPIFVVIDDVMRAVAIGDRSGVHVNQDNGLSI